MALGNIYYHYWGVYMKDTTLVPLVIMVLVLLFSCWIIIQVLRQQGDIIQNQCDAIYGQDNWTFNDTTGEGQCAGYIGNCWKCVRYIHSDDVIA